MSGKNERRGALCSRARGWAHAVVMACLLVAPTAWAGNWCLRWTTDGNEMTHLNYMTAGFPTRMQACQAVTAPEWRVFIYGYTGGEVDLVIPTVLGVTGEGEWGGCLVQMERPGAFVFQKEVILYSNQGTEDCGPDQEMPLVLAPPPPECDVCKGNPIYPLRGVKRETVDTGLAIGRTTLKFIYDSTRMVPKLPVELQRRSTGLDIRGGPLGDGLWSSSLHRAMFPSHSVYTSTTGPRPTLLDRGDGAVRTYASLESSGPPKPQPGETDLLTLLPTGEFRHEDSRAGTQEIYDATGRLLSMAWLDGTRIDYAYDAERRLRSATDNRGRSLSFTYVQANAAGARRIDTVTDAAGGQVKLTYSGQNPSAITWADGTVRQLHYERAGLPWALTGVSDERGIRYATFGYDAQGRAISTEHAGGVDRYAVSYTKPPSIWVTEVSDGSYVSRTYDWMLPEGMVMTEPSGQATSWTAVSVNGRNQFASQSQPAGAGSLASNKGQSYDENGDLAGEDDFNGNRRCYANDPGRNLRTVSVEGLGQEADCAVVKQANASLPGGARKTSTQWHARWPLVVRTAEPNRLTMYVYNGEPDPFNGGQAASCAAGATLPDGALLPRLCKQVEQATTDGDGHLGFNASLQAGPPVRVSTWTYNERGQVLTSKGTRGSVNETETRSYYVDTTADHTLGDLATITDARGKVTTFNRYNKLGHVLQSTDSEGTVTAYTYDLRQRLLSMSESGWTITFEYDAAGQLKKATLPNGSWVGFDYDDAHRLVAVYDDDDNRIDYVLDNAGKRVSTSTKDPAGALKASLARVMDALGRTQRSTGQEE